MEIRTERGKLVGVLDEQTNIFCIKDRNKEILIEVPPEGLKLHFTPGDGKIEEVHIPPSNEKFQVA